MTRWLLTGGVGFIGYHVAEALLARGDEVTIVDDFSESPYPTRYKRRNRAHLTQRFPKVSVVEASVTDRERMNALVKGKSGVIHLAGLAGVRPSFASPARYAEVNVQGTASLFEAAMAEGIRNFTFASSSSVYGNSTPLPATEEAACAEPESPYAASKRAAELITKPLCAIRPDARCVALRFFTVYGPRQRPEMAITLFMRAVLEGRPITMFGDGSMRRDFTHVDDITRGVVAAADAPHLGWTAYNLGSGAPVTLAELVAGIEAVTGKKAIIERAGKPAGDVDATYASIEKAKRELGWAPQRKLVEGLETVRDWVAAND
jgi:UDP-glucuronate 4-epimerase